MLWVQYYQALKFLKLHLAIRGQFRGFLCYQLWGEVIRRDIAPLQLTENMTLDWKVWRIRIRVEGYQVEVCPYQQVGVHCLFALTSSRRTTLVVSCFSIFVTIYCFVQFDCSIVLLLFVVLLLSVVLYFHYVFFILFLSCAEVYRKQPLYLTSEQR